ncbi:MAG TPA: RagB/SusD family nutrient uptake outer membrane protein [Parasegetibacter sp.]
MNHYKKLKRSSLFLRLFSAALVILLLPSCNKFLEHLPDQRTELNSPAKVSELLVTAYPQGNYICFNEAMSDNATDNFGAAQVDAFNTEPYFWRDVLETQQDSPDYYWNSCYRAIAAANQALDAIENAPNPEAYRAQKGEALVCRAYAHFMLVTLFAKTYNPATADSDPGIPYVLEPEVVVFKQYDRNTVKYVYEKIEKDLQEGLPLIDDSKYKVPRFHFNRNAARAFAARFYLFKREYDKVIQYATEAFPSGNWIQNMRPWLTTYQDYSSTELGLNYVKTSENANLLLASTVSRVGRYFYRWRYNTSENLIKRITFNGYPSPAGPNLVFAYKTWYQTSFRGIYYVRKFSEHFVRTSINATTGTAYTMVPLFTTEELLFNRAEAYASKGELNNAINDVNIFLSARIKGYSAATHSLTKVKAAEFYNTSDTAAAIVKAVLDLKRAEFVHEGMRWFDILRHDIPVTHTHVDGSSQTLEPGDPRRILQIPQEAAKIIGSNPR